MEKEEKLTKPDTYRLSGQYMVGTQLLGLEICDDRGNKKLVKIEDIHELIRRGMIYGCTLTEHKGSIKIRSKYNKIASLPFITTEATGKERKFKAIARVFKDRCLIGYKVTDETGKSYNISKDKVWDIARNKGFTNVSAAINNDYKILRGIGIRLTDLPTVNV